jgi:hypothetical protein
VNYVRNGRSVEFEILDRTGKVVLKQEGDDPVAFRASASTRFLRVSVVDELGASLYRISLQTG